MTKEKQKKFRTPLGKISFPYLDEIDSKRPESSHRFSAELYIPLKDLNESPEGIALKDEVLRVGRDYFDDQSLTFNDFKNPFTVTDALPEQRRMKLPEPVRNGHALIRAKTINKPTVFGPGGKKDAFVTAEQIKTIKGGDLCFLVVDVYPYKQQGGGVTIGLKAVQLKEKGEAFGRGDDTEDVLDCIQEFEVDASDITGDDLNNDLGGETATTTSEALNDLIS